VTIKGHFSATTTSCWLMSSYIQSREQYPNEMAIIRIGSCSCDKYLNCYDLKWPRRWG